MLTTPDRGCLLLVDISGYTSFLGASELEHAQDILRDLTQTVVGALRPQFKLAKLEGDAAFCYVVTERIDGSLLLDTIDATFFAYRRRLDAVQRATSCDCNACILIPKLSLKFVVHHGSFVRQRLYGVEELTGTDVIIAHRLLKNRIVEEHSVRAYAFLTDACVAAAGLDPEVIGMTRHDEAFESVGEIGGWVTDLDARWVREQEQRHVRVGGKEAFATLEMEVAADPSTVWAFVTDPSNRPQYVPGIVRIDETLAGGRRGIGATNHCVHGAGASLEEVLDWRPFEYFTLKNSMAGVPSWVTTEEVAPTEAGSRVTIRFQRMRNAKDRAAFVVHQDGMLGLYQVSLESLRDRFAADRDPNEQPAAS